MTFISEKKFFWEHHLGIALALLETLQYLHDHNWFHCDLHFDGENDFAFRVMGRICDFGLWKHKSQCTLPEHQMLKKPLLIKAISTIGPRASRTRSKIIQCSKIWAGFREVKLGSRGWGWSRARSRSGDQGLGGKVRRWGLDWGIMKNIWQMDGFGTSQHICSFKPGRLLVPCNDSRQWAVVHQHYEQFTTYQQGS